MNPVIFAQGDPADAVLYIQKGKVKVTVGSDQGKEAVIALLNADHFLAKDAWPGGVLVAGKCCVEQDSSNVHRGGR
jgi:CRP/FNR family cyclic AMP-dependent transcriptional regulator